MQDAGGRGPCMIKDVTTRARPRSRAAQRRPRDPSMARRSATAPRCSTRSPCTPRATPSSQASAAQHRGGRQGPADHPRCAAPQGDRRPMVETNFIGVEDGTVYDLSSLHGRMGDRRVVRSRPAWTARRCSPSSSTGRAARRARAGRRRSCWRSALPSCRAIPRRCRRRSTCRSRSASSAGPAKIPRARRSAASSCSRSRRSASS